MTHIHVCIGNLTIIGSNNGLSPGRCQAIIWTNAGILWIGPLGTNFNEILIEICIFSFKKVHLKLSGNWRPFCLGLGVLTPNPGLLTSDNHDGITFSEETSEGLFIFKLTKNEDTDIIPNHLSSTNINSINDQSKLQEHALNTLWSSRRHLHLGQHWLRWWLVA